MASYSAQDALSGDTRTQFVAQLWDLVNDNQACSHLCWQPGGDGFRVKDVTEFEFFIRANMRYGSYKEFTAELADWGFVLGISPKTDAVLFDDEDAFRDESSFGEEGDTEADFGLPPAAVAEDFYHPYHMFTADGHTNGFAVLRSMSRRSEATDEERRRRTEAEVAEARTRDEAAEEARRRTESEAAAAGSRDEAAEEEGEKIAEEKMRKKQAKNKAHKESKAEKKARKRAEKEAAKGKRAMAGESQATVPTNLMYCESPPVGATTDSTGTTFHSTTNHPRSTCTNTTQGQESSKTIHHVVGSSLEPAQTNNKDGTTSDFQPRLPANSLDGGDFDPWRLSSTSSPVPSGDRSRRDSDEGSNSLIDILRHFRDDGTFDDDDDGGGGGSLEKDAFESSKQRLEQVLKKIVSDCDSQSLQKASNLVEKLVAQLEKLLTKTSTSSMVGVQAQATSSLSSLPYSRETMHSGGPDIPPPLHTVYHSPQAWEAPPFRDNSLMPAKPGVLPQELQYRPLESANTVQPGAFAHESVKRMRVGEEQDALVVGGLATHPQHSSTSAGGDFSQSGVHEVPPPSFTNYFRATTEPFGHSLHPHRPPLQHSSSCPRGLPEVDDSNMIPVPFADAFTPYPAAPGGMVGDKSSFDFAPLVCAKVEATTTATTVNPTFDSQNSFLPTGHGYHERHANVDKSSLTPWRDAPPTGQQHPLLSQHGSFVPNNTWQLQGKFAEAAMSTHDGWIQMSGHLLDQPFKNLEEAQWSDEDALIGPCDQNSVTPTQQSPLRLIEVAVRLVIVKPVRLLTKKSPSLQSTSKTMRRRSKSQTNDQVEAAVAQA